MILHNFTSTTGVLWCLICNKIVFCRVLPWTPLWKLTKLPRLPIVGWGWGRPLSIRLDIFGHSVPVYRHQVMKKILGPVLPLRVGGAQPLPRPLLSNFTRISYTHFCKQIAPCTYGINKIHSFGSMSLNLFNTKIRRGRVINYNAYNIYNWIIFFFFIACQHL